MPSNATCARPSPSSIPTAPSTKSYEPEAIIATRQPLNPRPSHCYLAYLTDRVLVAANEPELYGTQYTHDPDGLNLRPQAVADSDRLGERRAAMGLEPAAEYDQRMRGY
ncbi:DUF6624 domain-containing protein [Streptomyces fulvoviolaceus]|uniref:DUF6624 domain-containing protein n=1 Tax=Streptomyces fulvoviolaceus TaxID=285535 RepID=UPI0021C028B3|nr:DUF6624 domain-containing protein [Streptomyces fulvoviolaceus]MCT9075296.1 hypothetical protein [Streptomyces fulvoviolaceus]